MSASSPSPIARGVWRQLPGVLYFACLAALLLAMGFLLVRRPLFGRSDFWAHAAVGRWIWQTGHVPGRTLFLWTADEPWVDPSWLFQVLCYGLTEIGQPEQLPLVVVVFTAVLSLLPFVLVCVVWRSAGRLSCWMAVLLLLALQGIGGRIETKPELCTVLFLSVLMMFLLAWSRARDGSPDIRRRRSKYFIGAGVLILFAAWVNLDGGGVILGLLLLTVTACADLVQDRWNKRSCLLALITLLVPLALCINPYGLDYWRAYRTIGMMPFAHGNDWQPISKNLRLPPTTLTAVVVVTAFALLAWSMSAKRRLAHQAWLLLMGAACVLAPRNVWPFTLTGLMVLAANARSMDPECLWKQGFRFVRRPFRGAVESVPALPGLFRWLLRSGVLAWLTLECAYLAIAVRPWEPLMANRLERGIARFIHNNELTGRAFNDYESSGYLEWSLAGHPDLFIDRLKAYPDEVIQDYLHIVYLSERGCDLLDEPHIEVIVLTTNRASSLSLAMLADYLDESDQWARVYVDKDGVIWVRKTPTYEHLWRPKSHTISNVSFHTLERFGEDSDILSPATGPEYVGGRNKP